MTARQILGITGGILVLLGIFLPAASAPVTGKLSVMAISGKHGIVMACLAILAAVFSIRKVFSALWPAGAASAFTLIFVYYDGKARLLGKPSLGGPVWANNFVKSMQSAAMRTVHYQWGLAVIMAGIVLMLLAAASGRATYKEEM